MAAAPGAAIASEVLLCRVWLPELVQPAGAQLRQALEGEGGSNLAYLRKKYPTVSITVSGETWATVASQRLHLLASSHDKLALREVVGQLADLAESACDQVGDSLGLSDDQVQSAFHYISAQKQTFDSAIGDAGRAAKRPDEGSTLPESKRHKPELEASSTPGPLVESTTPGCAAPGMTNIIARRLELAMRGTHLETLVSAIKWGARVGVSQVLLAKAELRKSQLDRVREVRVQVRSKLKAALRDEYELDELKAVIKEAQTARVSPYLLGLARDRLAKLELEAADFIEVVQERRKATCALERAMTLDDIEILESAVDLAISMGVSAAIIAKGRKRMAALKGGPDCIIKVEPPDEWKSMMGMIESDRKNAGARVPVKTEWSGEPDTAQDLPDEAHDLRIKAEPGSDSFESFVMDGATNSREAHVSEGQQSQWYPRLTTDIHGRKHVAGQPPKKLLPRPPASQPPKKLLPRPKIKPGATQFVAVKSEPSYESFEPYPEGLDEFSQEAWEEPDRAWEPDSRDAWEASASWH
eukprot:TRINITY_DN47405_c0_g1_i1.p1 TRINITY_DN47405_c0_g1~~TRINITY_DN47405_c0_g1_i1.p1  ORF type:complete len:542 (-),score=88.20 TRINITY_DN47405_c0_g1_i1:102-1685(-)